MIELRWKIGRAILATDKGITKFFHLEAESRIAFYKAMVILPLIAAAVIEGRFYIYSFLWGLSDVFAAAVGL